MKIRQKLGVEIATFAEEYNYLSENAKHFDELGLSGTEVGKSYRSRQEVSVSFHFPSSQSPFRTRSLFQRVYSVFTSKIGFNTAENEPFKDC